MSIKCAMLIHCCALECFSIWSNLFGNFTFIMIDTFIDEPKANDVLSLGNTHTSIQFASHIAYKKGFLIYFSFAIIFFQAMLNFGVDSHTPFEFLIACQREFNVQTHRLSHHIQFIIRFYSSLRNDFFQDTLCYLIQFTYKIQLGVLSAKKSKISRITFVESGYGLYEKTVKHLSWFLFKLEDYN